MNRLRAELDEVWESLSEFGKWVALITMLWLRLLYTPALPAPKPQPRTTKPKPVRIAYVHYRAWDWGRPDVFDRRQVRIIGTHRRRLADV